MDSHTKKRVLNPLGDLSFSAPSTNRRKVASTFDDIYNGFSSYEGANSLSVTGILQDNKTSANYFNDGDVSDPSPFNNTKGHVYSTLMNIPDPSRDENYILYFRDNGSIRPHLPVFIKRKTLINSSAFPQEVFRSKQKRSTTHSKEADGFDLFTVNRHIIKNIDYYDSVKKVQSNIRYIGVISDAKERYDRDASNSTGTYAFVRYAGVTILDKRALQGHMNRNVDRGVNEIGYITGTAIHPALIQDYNSPPTDEYKEICDYLNEDLPEDEIQARKTDNRSIGELSENSTFYIGNGLRINVAGFDIYLLLCKAHLQAPKIVNGVVYDTIYVYKLWVCMSKVKPDPVIDCGFGELDIYGNKNSEYNCRKEEKGITIKLGTITTGINGFNNSMSTDNYILFIQ